MQYQRPLMSIAERRTGLYDSDRRRAGMVDIATAVKRQNKYALESGFVPIDVSLSSPMAPYGVPLTMIEEYKRNGCFDNHSCFAEAYVQYLNDLYMKRPAVFDGFKTAKAICITCDDYAYESRMYHTHVEDGGDGNYSSIYTEKARFVFRNWLISMIEGDGNPEVKSSWGIHKPNDSVKVAHVGEIARPRPEKE